MYVKLISSDGQEFIVKREHALTSGTIKAMLSGPGEYEHVQSPAVMKRHLFIVEFFHHLFIFLFFCVIFD